MDAGYLCLVQWLGTIRKVVVFGWESSLPRISNCFLWTDRDISTLYLRKEAWSKSLKQFRELLHWDWNFYDEAEIILIHSMLQNVCILVLWWVWRASEIVTVVESSYLSWGSIMKKVCQVRSPKRIYGPHFQAENVAMFINGDIISWTEGEILLNFTVMLLLKWNFCICRPKEMDTGTFFARIH